MSNRAGLFSYHPIGFFPISFKPKVAIANKVHWENAKKSYYEKWVGRHAPSPPRRYVKRKYNTVLKVSKNCHFDPLPPLKCFRNKWVVPNRANPQNLPDSLTLYIMITFRDSLNALLNRPSLAGGVLQTPLTLDKSTFSDTDDLTRKNRASRKR